MINGLIALITSGILLNPMVILGIICGIYIMNTHSESDVIGLFQNTDFYISMFVIAFLFAFLFEKVYFAGGKKINWKVMLGITLGRFVTLCITSVFTCLFLFSFSFGDNTQSQKEPQEMTLETLIQMQQLEQPKIPQETKPKKTINNKTKTNEIIFK